MGGPPGRGPGSMGSPSMAQAAAADLQADIVRLRDDLKLTTTQQRLFDAYIDKIMSFGDDIQRSQFALRSLPSSETSSPKKFGQLVDAARNRLAALEDIAEAGTAVYANLSPGQKSIADRRLAEIAWPLVSGDSMRGPDDGGMRGPRGRMP